ncbi:MAG: PQQ-binding-like beta-propeller repeat protein, partial [Chloroflexi bacterium]|nr:PQQ-binding-like beta-propeller repeat protein [Chloroflexota bacterium]
MKTSQTLRLALLLLCLFGLTACVGGRIGVSWPSIGLIDLNGEQHIALAYNNDVALLTPSNGLPARLLNPVNGQPLRDNDGNPRSWIFRGSDNGGGQFYAQPIPIAPETMLIADNNSRLLLVDTVVLDVKRSLPIEGKVVASMLAADGLLYVPFQDGGLAAYALDGLRELWRVPTEEGVWAKPLLVGDLLIFPSLDHYLYAVDRETGRERWKVDLGGGIASTPLLARDRLYVGSFNKRFFEISLEGDILSSYETQNWVWGTPAIDANDIVYLTDLSGYVHALDTEAGLALRWSQHIAERGIRAGPLVVGDRVIVASRDGKVYWLHRDDGALINAREIDDRPELLGDMLLLEPSATLDIDEPLLLVTSVHDGRLLIA